MTITGTCSTTPIHPDNQNKNTPKCFTLGQLLYLCLVSSMQKHRTIIFFKEYESEISHSKK